MIQNINFTITLGFKNNKCKFAVHMVSQFFWDEKGKRLNSAAVPATVSFIDVSLS